MMENFIRKFHLSHATKVFRSFFIELAFCSEKIVFYMLHFLQVFLNTFNRFRKLANT